MQKLNNYIIEKLKINKDTKIEKRSFPKEDDPVLLTEEENNKITMFYFGNIYSVSSDGFSVTYMRSGNKTSDYFYFNSLLDPHWMGRTAKAGLLCYDKEFALQELKKALSSKKYVFDNTEYINDKKKQLMTPENMFLWTKEILEENK